MSEAANQAITPNAERVLLQNNISVLPGIVANAGGVIVSYFEWRKNRGDRKHQVDFAEEKRWVISELTKIMHSVTKNIYMESKKQKCSFSSVTHRLSMKIIRDQLKIKHSYTE